MLGGGSDCCSHATTNERGAELLYEQSTILQGPSMIPFLRQCASTLLHLTASYEVLTNQLSEAELVVFSDNNSLQTTRVEEPT